jgi:hypothetical protein
MIMRKFTTVALVAVIGLAGCNSAPPEKLPEDNYVEVANETANTAVDFPLPVENASNAANSVAPAAPPPTLSEQQQMNDDADATGMTARLPDEAPASGNETAPVK